MDPQRHFCPNFYCLHRGKAGHGNVRVHSRKEGRFRCATCGHTFAATRNTPFYRLHKPQDLAATVLTLLAQVTHKVLRKDARLREWSKRIRRRRGSTIARVAVMRKLATILWHMLSKRKSYAECRELAAARTNQREKHPCG